MSDEPLPDSPPPAAKKKRPPLRLIVVAILAILALILVLQNKEPVTTQILFATVVMPQAVLLTVTFLLGLAVGLLFAFVRKRTKG